MSPEKVTFIMITYRMDESVGERGMKAENIWRLGFRLPGGPRGTNSITKTSISNFQYCSPYRPSVRVLLRPI